MFGGAADEEARSDAINGSISALAAFLLLICFKPEHGGARMY